EKLDDHLKWSSIELLNETKSCGVWPASDEPQIYRFFSCQLDVNGGVLHYVVAFNRSGGIEYTQADARKK
ncbi:MAG: hypothetical protein RIR95_1034, partial [Pseudomonadota bacterium]